MLVVGCGEGRGGEGEGVPWVLSSLSSIHSWSLVYFFSNTTIHTVTVSHDLETSYITVAFDIAYKLQKSQSLYTAVMTMIGVLWRSTASGVLR